MRVRTVAVISAIIALLSGNAWADDVCEILARSLQQDVLTQGTDWQQFSQFQKLVRNEQFDDWNKVSSEFHGFAGSLNIPGEVDFAIGDDVKSNENNWKQRRAKFNSMTLQQTGAAYKASISARVSSVAVIKAITDCGTKLADQEGVYTQLVTVSPNRDRFTLQLWRRTSGDPAWNLIELSPQSDITCEHDEQAASEHKPYPIHLLSTPIVCKKSPNKHVSIAVQTTAGKPAYFEIEAISEELKGLHEEIQLARDEIAATRGEISGIAAALQAKTDHLHAQLQRQIMFGGAYAKEDPCNPPPSEDNAKRNPLTNAFTCPAGFTPYEIGRFRSSEGACGVTQVVCQKQGIE